MGSGSGGPPPAWVRLAAALVAGVFLAAVVPASLVADASAGALVVRLSGVVSEPIDIDANGSDVVVTGNIVLDPSVVWEGSVVRIVNAGTVTVSLAVRGDVEAVNYFSALTVYATDSLVLRRLTVRLAAGLPEGVDDDLDVYGAIILVSNLRSYIVDSRIAASVPEAEDYGYSATGLYIVAYSSAWMALTRAQAFLNARGAPDGSYGGFIAYGAFIIFGDSGEARSIYGTARVTLKPYNETSVYEDGYISARGVYMGAGRGAAARVSSVRGTAAASIGPGTPGAWMYIDGVVVANGDYRLGAATGAARLRVAGSAGVYAWTRGVSIHSTHVKANALAARGVRVASAGDTSFDRLYEYGVYAAYSHVEVNKVAVTGARAPGQPMVDPVYSAGIGAYRSRIDITGSYRLAGSPGMSAYHMRTASLATFAGRPVAMPGDYTGVKATLRLAGAAGSIETPEGPIHVSRGDVVEIRVSGARHLAASSSMLLLAEADAEVYVNGELAYTGTVTYAHFARAQVTGEVHVEGPGAGRGTVRIGAWTPVPVGFDGVLTA